MARIPFRPPLPPLLELIVAAISLVVAVVEYKRKTSEQKPPWLRPPGS